MATNAQIRANRSNAQHSTGPKTEQGKLTVSGNAVKHGIFYNAINPNTPFYQDLVVGLFQSLNPEDELRRCLVEQIAVTIVRLKRLVRHEEYYLSDVDFQSESGPPFSAVGAYIASGAAALTTKYENALNRQLRRLLRIYAATRCTVDGLWSARKLADPSTYLYPKQVDVDPDTDANLELPAEPAP